MKNESEGLKEEYRKLSGEYGNLKRQLEDENPQIKDDLKRELLLKIEDSNKDKEIIKKQKG